MEPQNDDPIEVAKFSLNQIINEENVKERPLFVEDAGLFIDALKGFPGVYSAYVLKTLGNDGILKLMNGIIDRNAAFRSTIALITEEDKILIFQGITNGSISTLQKGEEWGFNPIFIPNNSNNKTYAELGKEKISFSHRIRSLNKMKEYFEKLL